jgi:hypothetical protein
LSPKHSPLLQDEINKRLILNLLIQGAASHVFLTANHLVKDELESIRPGITTLYDKFAISGSLNYCIGEIALWFGRPNYWFGFSRRPQKIFASSPFLRRYMNSLARETTRDLQRRGLKKGVIGIPFLHWLQFVFILTKTYFVDKRLRPRLDDYASQIVSEIFKIPITQLDGCITNRVAYAPIRTPKTMIGQMVLSGAVGFGGVQRIGNSFRVVGRAFVFPLLVHELAKGTMELICLHGLNKMSEELYEQVMLEADQLEFETYQLQAGPAAWRHFLEIVPRNCELSRAVMCIAKLPPVTLDRLMTTMMEYPNEAAEELELLMELPES